MVLKKNLDGVSASSALWRTKDNVYASNPAYKVAVAKIVDKDTLEMADGSQCSRTELSNAENRNGFAQKRSKSTQNDSKTAQIDTKRFKIS